MIQKALKLYCGNEHGTGDVTFPEEGVFDPNLSNARILRREAHRVGWRRMQREDYCPGCVEIDKEEKRG